MYPSIFHVLVQNYKFMYNDIDKVKINFFWHSNKDMDILNAQALFKDWL